MLHEVPSFFTVHLPTKTSEYATDEGGCGGMLRHQTVESLKAELKHGRRVYHPVTVSVFVSYLAALLINYSVI